MSRIFVDADACPVKAEVEKVAARHGLETVMVANGGLRPSRDPMIRIVIVPQGPDAADDYIAENIAANDICITADIPLASRCLEKGAAAISPTGRPFDAQNIGMALSMRALNQHLREAEGGQGYNAGFTPKDRSRFLEALERAVQAAKRVG